MDKILEKGVTTLVLRVNDFKGNHFIDEHKRIIQSNAYVWMLKAGRPLAEKSIKAVMEEKGYLILKEPKHSGNRYYFCNILDYYQGDAKADFVYPDYYEELEYEYNLSGTWLKISDVIPIAINAEVNFELVKGGKKMTEIVNSTRSPILFVKSLKDLHFSDGEMKEA